MSYSTSRSVPFEITDINHGLQVAKGLFKIIDNGLELEFELQDAIMGVIKSDVKTIRLPYSELESIKYKKGWFSDKVILEAGSMKTFEDIPGTEQGVRTLKVKRKNRKEADSIVSKARMQFSEYRLDQLDKGDSDN